jgi:hypothetical protein
MQTAASLGENGTSPYGLGLEVGDDGGLKTVGHGGGDRGIAAYVIRYPAHDLSVAVLCNLDNLNARVGTLVRQVAALYLPARSEPVSRDVAPVTAGPALTRAELASKAGLIATWRPTPTAACTCGTASCGRRWTQAKDPPTASSCVLST